MRRETISLAPGSAGVFGGASTGFVVAALNAASADCRGSLIRLAIWLTPLVEMLAEIAETCFTFDRADRSRFLACARGRHAVSFEATQQQAGRAMSHVTYRIVQHDDGW